MKTDLTSLLPRFHMSNIQRYSPPGCGSGLSWNRRKYIVFMETTCYHANQPLPLVSMWEEMFSLKEEFLS